VARCRVAREVRARDGAATRSKYPPAVPPSYSTSNSRFQKVILIGKNDIAIGGILITDIKNDDTGKYFFLLKKEEI
jgi:hypothetical protein